ncbi:MAG: spore coat protein CotJB [Clostridiales bacterium]|nr:spore coat protein CotJB [Clostridiales bacterium]MDY4171976.1 spore coat protein CotJB [Evtepia sp.]
MFCANSNGNQSSGNRPACPAGQGSLPACGPFAVPFVVSQGAAPQRYSKTKALENGTLFPDLDLPFHLKVNAPQLADTDLNQLRALDFVIQELGLYLDTHPNDSEAFALFQNYVELEKTARESYVEEHGPLTQNDAAMDDTYTWGKGPWPWQYTEEEA